MENPIVPEEAIIPEEELELEIPDDTEDVEALKAQVAKTDKFARQAIARAKKAEDENRALKAPKPEPAPQNQASPLADIDERILKSQGVPDDLLKEIKKVASVTGQSLIDAQSDPYIVARKGELEKEKKQKEASLGASRGSGSVKVKKDFGSPDLTRKEHMELVAETLK